MRRTRFRNPHQYVCMKTAVDAGLAPPVHYIDPTEGVAIMDFIPQRPLSEYPGGPAALARDLGRMIARLQRTLLFPQLLEYPVFLDRMLGFIRGSGMFAAGLLDAHAAGFERIRQVYPWNASSPVSSHNDPNPRNIIFDGERLWLIDWETAFRNDPLTDVAILAENFAGTPELEDALLQGWLERPADRELRARLVLMRQLTRLYYAGNSSQRVCGNAARCAGWRSGRTHPGRLSCGNCRRPPEASLARNHVHSWEDVASRIPEWTQHAGVRASIEGVSQLMAKRPDRPKAWNKQPEESLASVEKGVAPPWNDRL